jgi:predicted DNA-binding antitoxin AbrB/MazE fold protein
MSQRVRAIFHDGVFVPKQPCDLPEGSEVELTVNDPYTIPPEITDPAERAALLEELVKSMRENPIPANAPRFTRDELHERR